MATDPLVDKVARQIAEAIEPEKIILFGSRVTGDARPDSDIDLVVVYDGPESEREIQRRIRGLFEHPDFSLDLFVMRPNELDELKSVANTLAREVTERGVVCYG